MKAIFFLLIYICLQSSLAVSVASGKVELQPVTLQLKWFHQFQFAGYYAALHKGFYHDEGLDVRIKPGGPKVHVNDEVLSGRADFGVLASELIEMRTSGEPLILLAVIMQHSIRAIIVRADSGINGPADLIGKRLMINLNEDSEFRAMFAAEGIPYEKLSITPKDRTADSKFIEGEIDGLNGSIGNQPFIFSKSNIAVKAIRPISYGIDFYGDSLFTSEDYLHDHPELVKKFRRATLKGWDYALNNIEETVSLILEEYSPANSREHILFEANAMRELILPDLVEIGHISIHRIERIAQLYADLGLVPDADFLKGFIYNPTENTTYIRKVILGLSVILIIASVLGVLLLIFNSRLKKQVAKQTEELSSNNSLLKAVIEGTTDAIFLKNLKGQYLLANSSTLKAIGKAEHEVIGKDDSELFPATSAMVINEVDSNVIQSGQSQIAEEHLETSYGESYWLANKSPYRDLKGNIIGLIGISRDISDLKKVETEKKELQQRLIQAQKMESIGTLAGGIAHDFNNMLTVIQGNAEMAMELLDPAQPLYADLNEILKAAGRSADITRQLLAFARKQTIAPKILDLNETVEGMLKMLRRLIGEDIDLVWMPGYGLWQVKVDPSQIDQILVNLFINARAAIAGVGKITVMTENCTLDEYYSTTHTDCIPGEYIRITVSDSGCGMDKMTLAHIFEPFFTTKGVGEGTGLGLATVFGIVKQNSGIINVYSEPGQGTSFAIHLPRYLGTAQQSNIALEMEPAVHGHETILLVEDESTILGMTVRMLERLGYTVLAASSPEEAMRLVAEFSGEVHMLMTDVVMPGMNGRDLADRLLQDYPTLRCLFMSGYTANIITNQGVLSEGMNFIQKPFSIKELAAKVKKVLERKDN